MKDFLKIYFILFYIITASVSGQFYQEQVSFESANPFSLSDIIIALDEQEKQSFGKLTIPIDSLNPNEKYPLIIGLQGVEAGKSITLIILKCIRTRLQHLVE